MKKVRLTQGKCAIVSNRDFKKVSQLKWQLQKPRDSSWTFYARRSKARPSRKAIMLHRFILDLPSGDKRIVHHKNGNGLDNRRSNLEITSQARNCRLGKLRRDNSSGEKGIRWQSGACNWQIQVCLGGFKTLKNAIAHKKKMIKLLERNGLL